jgi:hypothetical protein
VAPHFVAGVIVGPDGIVTEAAPILGYSVGWTGRRLRECAASKGWTTTYVEA